MIENRQPSILRVVQIDFWAFIAVVFPIIMMGLYLYDRYARASVTTSFLSPVLVVSVLGLGVFLWRYLSILSLYQHGIEMKATIYDVTFYRDRGRVSCLYEIQCKRYLSSQVMLKTARTKVLNPGDEVLVLVDPNQPKRAVIKHLFL